MLKEGDLVEFSKNKNTINKDGQVLESIMDQINDFGGETGKTQIFLQF